MEMTNGRVARVVLAATSCCLVGGLYAPCRAAVIEFSEASLVNGDVLAGSETFAPYGIHFTGSTKFAVDPLFVGAGGDNKGITTGTESPIMGVSFDAKATSVSFDGLSLNTDFYATAFDAGGNVLDTFHAGSQPGAAYVSHTFSGLGEIARVEFHDHNNFIGVGRLDYQPVPEPAAIGMCGLLAGVSMRRRIRR